MRIPVTLIAKLHVTLTVPDEYAVAGDKEIDEAMAGICLNQATFLTDKDTIAKRVELEGYDITDRVRVEE